MAQKAAQRVDTFVWDGIDRNGRKVTGENDAPNAAYVNAILRRQGIRPLKVRKRTKRRFQASKKITPKDIAVATRQLSAMISAGIPLAQAFDILARGQDNPSMQKLMDTIRQDVESGTNLSAALAKHPLYFDDLYCNLVDAGEQSGTLDALMDKIAAYKEKIESIKGKIKSALFYPAAVVVVAFIVTAVLLIFVIPQFEVLFQSFGGELPTLTQMVIGLSRWFQEWWYAVFGILGGSIAGAAYFYKRSPRLQYAMDRFVLRVPVVGEIVRKATIARYTRTLATMFGAGVPLVDALDAVAGASGNRVYYDAVMEIKSDVSTGQQLASSMEKTSLFPHMVLQMVAIGEESGELEVMLNKVADFFEQEVDDAVAALSSLIEPFIMVFLGVVIGGLVIAMYLPIFKIAAVI
jgi:type IV pilus assembly protein PilC